MPPRRRRQDPRQPLVEYLRVQRRMDSDLNQVLAQAARDAQRRIAASELGRPGIGATVRRAQLQGVLGAIRETQERLWDQGVGPLITSNLRDAQLAAVNAAMTMEDVIWEGLPNREAEAVARMVRETAEYGLEAEANRRARDLSPRVWHNRELANRTIERTIRAGVIQGLSAREMADTVRHYIRPDTRGGISYAAKRLARTELNNAFHERQTNIAKNQPWVDGVKWNLSGSHPRTDKCDEYANDDSFNLGPGVFPKGDVPSKPHPHCVCFMTYDLMPEDDFVANMQNFLQGG